MPNIVEYNSPVNTLQPSETGIEGLQRSGIRIRENYREAGQELGSAISTVGGQLGKIADEHMDMEQISQASAAVASAHDTLTSEWNDVMKTADPNDPTVGQKFLAQADDTLTKLQNAPTRTAAQRFMLERVDRLRDQLHVETHNGMAELAQVGLVKNATSTLNGLTNAAGNNPTLGNIKLTHETWDHSVDSLVQSNSNLNTPEAKKQAEAMRMRGHEQIDEAAIETMMLNDPAGAQRLANTLASDGYINKPKIDQAIKGAMVMQRQEQAANRANTMFAQEQAAHKSFAGVTAGAWDDVNKRFDFSKNPDQVKQFMLSDNPATAGMKLELHNAIEQSLKPQYAYRDDPTTVQTVNQRMELDPSDPDFLHPADLVKDLNDNKITRETWELKTRELNELIANPQIRGDMSDFNRAVQQFKPLIDTSTMIKSDGFGQYRYNELVQDTREAFIEGLRNGQSKRDLLDPNGPHSVFKNINDYFVKPEDELNYFGQKFSPQGGGVPMRVKVMEEFRRQHDEDERKKNAVSEAAKGLGYTPPKPSLAPMNMPLPVP